MRALVWNLVPPCLVAAGRRRPRARTAVLDEAGQHLRMRDRPDGLRKRVALGAQGLAA
jgi:hypothetical protein